VVAARIALHGRVAAHRADAALDFVFSLTGKDRHETSKPF
jgi:hypothetical protein